MTQTPIIRLFSLNTSSGIPIYRQLVDQIKQAVRMKLLLANQKLPSVRELASSLQINPMTISKAFAQLELEGVLIRQRGIGMLVAEQAEAEFLSKKIENPLFKFIYESREQNISDEQMITILQQYLSMTNDKTHK
ncbi:MAG: GntR family transcriptional regulator [Kangiellaceae bacterium]|nr:GntR family transcriptional regulator [Kangiellaceae bacterium]